MSNPTQQEQADEIFKTIQLAFKEYKISMSRRNCVEWLDNITELTHDATMRDVFKALMNHVETNAVTPPHPAFIAAAVNAAAAVTVH